VGYVAPLLFLGLPGIFGMLIMFIGIASQTIGAEHAAFLGLVFFAVALVFSMVLWLIYPRVRSSRWYGLFLLVSFCIMIFLCFCAALYLPRSESWPETGPQLLFLGLLTLLNAPFDWVSLGLTRALLRRGLEIGGWWPHILALVDAIFAAGIIALLAITMVVGVQTFDHLAEHSGGKRILPLEQLFDGVAAHPASPEYWWLYALLLSTMIPSLINLMIGGASFLRGVPGLPAILLGFMPAGKAVPQFDRSWIALVLAGQVFLGALLGIAAQAFLAVGVIFYILPWVGLGLLETAREVADFHLPGRVLAVFWGAS
jgi:hypothetical protein